jgi:general secretion pathway protein G
MSRSRGTARRRVGGFTLMELLVVILIIGLLTGIVAPRLLNQVSKSEVTAARAQLDAFDKALQAYRIDTGRFPDMSQGLQALVRAPGGESRWNGPYLRGTIPLDPWGRPYVYRLPGTEGRDYDIASLGSDGVTGGTGDATDLMR